MRTCEHWKLISSLIRKMRRIIIMKSRRSKNLPNARFNTDYSTLLNVIYYQTFYQRFTHRVTLTFTESNFITLCIFNVPHSKCLFSNEFLFLFFYFLFLPFRIHKKNHKRNRNHHRDHHVVHMFLVVCCYSVLLVVY